ncbi:MAG: type II toxin-antitoxin system VapC family toxin [Gemmatimonadetes bacterium]|nr:type II toxin-antitoxin system VapC family toxin [Gemmatimonadota bacterium]
MIARRLLVDTGAWLAIFHPRDQFHQPASAYLRQLRAEHVPLLVTDLILAELHLHLVRGLGPQRAMGHLDALKSDPLVEEVFVDHELEASAVTDWLRKYDDQPFTLTDAVSFAVMRARRVSGAFTFDRHFSVAGFATVPVLAGG